MPLQAIGNKILVLPDEPKQGVVVLTDQMPKTQGVVVRVGLVRRDGELAPYSDNFKAGDRIIFERMEAHDPGRVDVDGVPHFLMAEEQVLAILENDK